MQKLTIGIDARSITNKMCGVSRVTIRLIENLQIIDKINHYYIFLNQYAGSLVATPNFEFIYTNCNRFNPYYDLRFCKLVNRHKVNVFHSMHSWLPFFLPQDARIITTIHDLFAVTDPDFWKKRGVIGSVIRLYFSYLYRSAIRRSHRIITVSEYCRQEINRVYSEDPNKISVVYNAIGLPEETVLKVASIPFSKYLLYIGNCRSYKNVSILIQGFYCYKSRQEADPLLKLIIAGNDDYTIILDQAKSLGIEKDIHIIKNPPDSYIKYLLANATAFVFPSLREGFGIPILEAMQAGIPVISSDADALVEISGGATLIFNRNNFRDLADKIRLLISNSQMCKELIIKGHARAKMFSWQRSAQQLLKLYNNEN